MRSMGGSGRNEASHCTAKGQSSAVFSWEAAMAANSWAAIPEQESSRLDPLLRLAVRSFGGFQRVLHQRRHRHRPDSAGHGGDPAGAFGRGDEPDVADQTSVIESVD